RSTQGFNPKPRVVFALSLALGVIGHEEVVEIELNEEMAPDIFRERMTRHAPPGLSFTSARLIDKSLTAHVCQVTYRLNLLVARLVHCHCARAQILIGAHLWVERAKRRLPLHDIPHFFIDSRVVDKDLENDLLVTPAGTARKEEVLHFLLLDDCLQEGALFE